MADLRLPSAKQYPQWAHVLSVLRKAVTLPDRKAMLRRICLNDRAFLAYLLGYNDETHPWDDFHYWAMQKRIPALRAIPGCQSAWFQPRGTYKTAMGEVDLTHMVLSNPNVTIGIGSWKLDVASRILRKVKKNLEHPVLKWLFPEVLYDKPQSQSEKWTEEEAVVRRTSASKDATLKAFSVESMPTSLHFDFTYLDDVVERRNAFSADGIQKVKETLADLRSFRANPEKSQVEVRGTLWRKEDWHHDLMRKSDWHIERHPAIVESVEEHEDASVPPLKGMKPGDLLFPSALTEAVLESMLDEMGLWQYSGQVLMRLASDDKMSWSKDMVCNYYAPNDVAPPFNTYMFVDLATEGGDDMSVILVGAVLPNGNRYILDGWCGHDSPSLIASRIYDFHEKYGGNVTIEEMSGFQFFDEVLKQESRRRGKVVPHRRIKHRSASKWDRIWACDPTIRGKRLFTKHISEVDNDDSRAFFREYERQALAWPNTDLKDVLDCVADFCTMGVAPPDIVGSPDMSRRDLRRIYGFDGAEAGGSLMTKVPWLRGVTNA